LRVMGRYAGTSRRADAKNLVSGIIISSGFNLSISEGLKRGMTGESITEKEAGNMILGNIAMEGIELGFEKLAARRAARNAGKTAGKAAAKTAAKAAVKAGSGIGIALAVLDLASMLFDVFDVGGFAQYMKPSMVRELRSSTLQQLRDNYGEWPKEVKGTYPTWEQSESGALQLKDPELREQYYMYMAEYLVEQGYLNLDTGEVEREDPPPLDTSLMRCSSGEVITYYNAEGRPTTSNAGVVAFRCTPTPAPTSSGSGGGGGGGKNKTKQLMDTNALFLFAAVIVVILAMR
jgi:hypothetical protein